MKKILTYTSKVNYATSKTKSLKVGFPKEISKILDVYAGDELNWSVNVDGEELIVTVKKEENNELIND